MSSLRTAALLLLVAALADEAGAKELWEYNWIEVRSPHFRIRSAISDARTRALATDLENFRRAAELVTNIGRFEERIPTHLYVLPTPSRELGFRNNIIGYFLPEMRANYAAIADTGSISDEALKHEYAHFLVRNRDALSYPAWFDEGLAELLMTMHVEDGKVLEYGKPLPERVEWLASGIPWLSFRRLLEAGNSQEFKGDAAALFYAQSWLLMHYLMLGRPRSHASEETTTFLRLRSNGRPAVEAFEQAFSLKVNSLERTLIRYYGKGQYLRTKLSTPFPPVELATTAVPRDVIAAEIGLLCLIEREMDCAKRHYDASLAVNPDNAMALVGRADVLKSEQRFDEAEPLYRRAIALEPSNALHELDYGEYFLDRARSEQTANPAHAAELLAEARRHFARSYKLDPDVPETLAVNGASYFGDPAGAAPAVASLEEAHRQIPSQGTITLLLAQAYVAADRKPDAARVLRTLVAAAEEKANDAAQKLLAELGGNAPEKGDDAEQAAPDAAQSDAKPAP